MPPKNKGNPQAHENIDMLLSLQKWGQKWLQEAKYDILGTAGKAAIDIAPETIGELAGYDPRTLRVMAHYIQGSGEPYDIELSDAEWEDIIDDATFWGERGIKEWTPSTNPEKLGYEYMSGLMPGGAYTDPTTGFIGYNPLWDLLGETTVRRKKQKDDTYLYEIAGEKFDVVQGKGEKAYTWGTRPVSEPFANLLATLFSEIITKSTDESRSGSSKINIKDLHKVGKPFPLMSQYIDKP